MLAYYRAVALLWVTAARRPNELARLRLNCVRREWEPGMRDEGGQPLETTDEVCYLQAPSSKDRGPFWIHSAASSRGAHRRAGRVPRAHRHLHHRVVRACPRRWRRDRLTWTEHRVQEIVQSGESEAGPCVQRETHEPQRWRAGPCCRGRRRQETDAWDVSRRSSRRVTRHCWAR